MDKPLIRKRTLSLFQCIAGAMFLLAVVVYIEKCPEDRPSDVSVFFEKINYHPEKGREVLIVIPENGCFFSKVKAVEVVNSMDCPVLVVAQHRLALTTGWGFDSLRKKPFFIKTEECQRKGFYWNSPFACLIENGEILREVRMSSCGPEGCNKNDAETRLRKFLDYL